ncbi:MULTISPECIES: tripartite tricarboxylate transporter substrate binding protein [Ramlibacter]|uniref:Tripartite tricarboxylate transporter substrate binding protein n=1 Tax=Ramlibacter pinisoli TaxID=2682844 RepID=A0A6N8J0K5_9BURK|nr:MULTISPECIES: tripartite tricarboxylate transporter substrate binding protein [Ramlibacter]MBA2961774.1 tripartite tricarboxylate transporter substrate binding protein [Ramlibacter sp. CGMCC 1.13660]MVQ31716.1 tripartite tricarboxylate transporter substrate binding protein [Ramlibacter pinisoli]
MRRRLIAMAPALMAAAVLLGAGSAGAQQGFPNKPLRIITPYATGSSVDAMARIVGVKLSESLGQPVLVEPRPGANTVIGSEMLVKSPPDGYTLLLVSTTHVLNGLLIHNLPYDTFKDFAPVATIASSELILVASPKVPATNVKELVALAKTKPLTYATSSAGGPTHLAAELFSSLTGVKLTHIPYKGSGPAVTDLLGGHVDIGWTSPLTVIPHINAGKLKAIAISGNTRGPALPNVPTFSEAGLPGFDMRFWYALLAPAGTPKDIVNRLSSDIAKILVTPDMADKIAAQGAEPFVSSPEQFAAIMRADSARYEKVIKGAGIKVAE